MKLIHFILGVGLVLALYPVAHADDTDRLAQLTQLYYATRAVCGGLSDELQHLKNMTTGNTVVSGVGTAAGDAFYKKYPVGVFFIRLVGRAHRGVGMPPLVFWEIYDFPKHVQNVNNVLP